MGLRGILDEEALNLEQCYWERRARWKKGREAEFNGTGA